MIDMRLWMTFYETLMQWVSLGFWQFFSWLINVHGKNASSMIWLSWCIFYLFLNFSMLKLLLICFFLDYLCIHDMCTLIYNDSFIIYIETVLLHYYYSWFLLIILFSLKELDINNFNLHSSKNPNKLFLSL